MAADYGNLLDMIEELKQERQRYMDECISLKAQNEELLKRVNEERTSIIRRSPKTEKEERYQYIVWFAVDGISTVSRRVVITNYRIEGLREFNQLELDLFESCKKDSIYEKISLNDILITDYREMKYDASFKM